MCLLPLSLIFKFYRRIKPGYPKKTTDLPKEMDIFYHITLYPVYIVTGGIDFT